MAIVLRRRNFKLYLGTVCILGTISFLIAVKLMFNETKYDRRMNRVHGVSKNRETIKTEESTVNRIDFNVNDLLDYVKHFRHFDQMSDKFGNEFLSSLSTHNARMKPNFTARPLKVFVMLHSHNDPGYKKTFTDYFHQHTHKILSLAVEKMHLYKDLTFIWPEICFISKWWDNQTTLVRNKFKHLVKSGRLELASGGWVIPDEATPHYFSFIDQLTEGHLWIKENIGEIPDNSFDLDQFSLSSSARYILRRFGIKHAVVKRIHAGIKEYLMRKGMMNFNWRQTWDRLGEFDTFVQVPVSTERQSLLYCDICRLVFKMHFEDNFICFNIIHDIFHMRITTADRHIITPQTIRRPIAQVEPYEWLSFPDSCGPSRSVCSDLDLGDVTELPDERSSAFYKPIRLKFNYYTSVPDYAEKLVRQLKIKSSGYAHNVLLLPLGDDFRYTTPTEWDLQYKNTKTLMNYINSVDSFNVYMQFGTLADYFKEVELRSQANEIKYPTLTGDFLPFTLNNKYWSGFFTTRPFLKRLGRELQESVHAADVLLSLSTFQGGLSNFSVSCQKSLLKMLQHSRRELDMFQHHDAITGTSRDHVVKDYEINLSSAFNSAQDIIAFILHSFFMARAGTGGTRNEGSYDEQDSFQPCHVNFFPTSVKQSRDQLTKTVSINLSSESVTIIVFNSYFQERTEIISLSVNHELIGIHDSKGKAIPVDVRTDVLENRPYLFFKAHLPPLGVAVFKLSKGYNSNEMKIRTDNSDGDLFCESRFMNITFSRMDGSPRVICFSKGNFCKWITLGWYHYSDIGGAYTFPFISTNATSFQDISQVKLVSGITHCAVEVSYKYFKVEYMLYKTNGISDQYFQINILTDLSKFKSGHFQGEFAMRLETDLNNRNIFFTDSLGMQLSERKYRSNLPLGANVYPMTSMTVIEDKFHRLTLHSVQPHGVTSWKSGTLDVFIDRVAPLEEGGLNQGVYDSKLTLTKLFLQISSAPVVRGNDASLPTLEAILANDVIQHPVFSFHTHEKELNPNHDLSFVHVPRVDLPSEMSLVSLKCWVSENQLCTSVAVTLFRRAFTLVSKSKPITEQPVMSINIYHMFHFSTEWILSEMQQGSKKLIVIHRNQSIEFRQMDLKSFLFKRI